jgi:hypothetical protein
MEGEEVHRGIWWESLKERDQLKDLGVDVRTILQWVLNK